MRARRCELPIYFIILFLSSICAVGDGPRPETESRIARVVTGLYVRNSRDQWEPTDTWTIEDRLSRYNIPGVSIAVIDNSKLDWARAYGRVGANEAGAVTPETLFQAASLSKLLTAFATLQLVDLGLIDLGAPVDDYLLRW